MNWGEVFGLLVTVTGWTFDYIEESMTLPRLAELSAYWSDFPPLHLMVRAYLGIESKAKPKPDEDDQAKAEFFALFQNGALHG